MFNNQGGGAAIVRVLLPKYIWLPSGEELKKIIEGFRDELGFPQYAGVVDGPHIPIVSPTECPAHYFNRKGWHSIIMQGMVDNVGRFTEVYTGWPGRVHRAAIISEPKSLKNLSIS